MKKLAAFAMLIAICGFSFGCAKDSGTGDGGATPVATDDGGSGDGEAATDGGTEGTTETETTE